MGTPRPRWRRWLRRRSASHRKARKPGPGAFSSSSPSGAPRPSPCAARTQYRCALSVSAEVERPRSRKREDVVVNRIFIRKLHRAARENREHMRRELLATLPHSRSGCRSFVTSGNRLEIDHDVGERILVALGARRGFPRFVVHANSPVHESKTLRYRRNALDAARLGRHFDRAGEQGDPGKNLQQMSHHFLTPPARRSSRLQRVFACASIGEGALAVLTAPRQPAEAPGTFSRDPAADDWR